MIEIRRYEEKDKKEASANSRFAYLAVGTNPDKPAVVWTDEMLSKEEYDELPKE